MDAKAKEVESVYMEKRVFQPSKEFVEKAYIKTMEEYEKLWERSIKDPQGFWGEMAEEYIDWFKKWDGPVEEYSFKDDIYLRYFAGGKLNVTYNYGPLYHKALDREDGLDWLNGKVAEDVTPKLESAVLSLGQRRSENYWERTPGNAGYALSILLAWAREHPNGVFRVS